MKKLLFIVNPRAGKTKSTAPLFDAVAAFSRAGYLVRVFVTEAGGQARDIAAKWGGQYDLVVCAGGDGTLNETISGLMQLEQRPPLGYLPNGSTNDFAASLHLHTTVATAARAVAGGIPYSLDIGRHNDRYFAYVASFGAFTRSSYSASQAAKNALGHFAYILEGLGDLDSLRPYRCAIDADGEHFEGDFIFGAVCNSTSLGGLVKLDPKHVSMDDGTFELLLLRMPKTALDLQNLITAMTRMQYDYPGVIFRHVKNVVLTTNENISWSLDGEYAASAPRVEIQCLPGAIELVH
ncbi:MAG: diacylglycerol kinase family lipid kinase [Clostridiales bacterium]|nr:diacylglycerol kinase family lipid kinase [Clostridiales bacterium]